MDDRTEYLKIHEAAYRKLRSEGKASWSNPDDLAERMAFYRSALQNSGRRILILGCGDGETALSLADSGFNVTGIDISPTAIQWAKEKAQKRGRECQFLEANLAQASLTLRNFDSIIDDHCLHCIIGHDRERVLDQVFSLLNPKGTFIVRTHCGDPPSSAGSEFLQMWDPVSRCQTHEGVAGRYFGRPEEILEEFRSAGLSVIHERVLCYPDGWAMLEAIAKKPDSNL